MTLEFRRAADGSSTIVGSPEDVVLIEFVRWETHGSRDGVETWIAAVERGQQVPENEGELGGDGYSLTVGPEETVIESNFDQFPDATYPTDVVLGALREFRDWLRDNPRPQAEAVS